MFGKLPLFRTGTLPRDPTQALPGTEEKVRVMIGRAARREQLFHPLDGRIGASVAGPKDSAPLFGTPTALPLAATPREVETACGDEPVVSATGTQHLDPAC